MSAMFELLPGLRVQPWRFYLSRYSHIVRLTGLCYVKSNWTFIGARKVTSGQLPENVFWSYAIQLLSALRTIHHSNLSANGLSGRNILITYKNKLRISNVGVLDVKAYDPNVINSQHTLARLQVKSIFNFY